MRYQKFSPVPQLQPFVECYYIWEGNAGTELDVQTPPTNYCAMVFNYASPYRTYQNDGLVALAPTAFATGMFTSNYHLVLNGAVGMAGIVFKAAALFNFFGWRMSALVNSRVALTLLMGDQGARLLEAVGAAGNDEGRINILEDFLLSRLADAKSRLSVIDEAISKIDLHNGCITVEAVAQHFRVSRRYLEKKILEKTGVSPKFYARIKRFSTLSNRIVHSDRVDWQDIIVEYNFHDQSHLVKEFMEFNQMNPTHYHNLHTELGRFITR